MTVYNAPFIPFAIVDPQGRPTGQFQQFWQNAFNAAVANAVSAAEAAAAAAAAQTSANGAQSTANGAAGDATAAQTTANTALGLAETAVQQELGPAWADATGTAARTAFGSLGPVGPFTVSNPPTQAEVQAIGDALAIVSAGQASISQHLVAMINDLFANKALTNP